MNKTVFCFLALLSQGTLAQTAVRECRADSLLSHTESPLARAIELGVDACTDVLIQCQKNQSVVLTTPLLRSNAQQDRCYRF